MGSRGGAVHTPVLFSVVATEGEGHEPEESEEEKLSESIGCKEAPNGRKDEGAHEHAEEFSKKSMEF